MRISDWSSDVCSSDLNDLSAVLGLGPGFHPLTSSPTSGAIDYIRSPLIKSRLGCLLVVLQLLNPHKRIGVADAWQRGTDVDALAEIGRASCRERGCQDG